MDLRKPRRIDVSPGFVAFLCAYYYFDPLNSFYFFLLSATLHEVGHLLCITMFKIPIHSIKLSMSGAQIETPQMSYVHELIAAASGPAFNFILLCVFRKSAPLLAFLNFALLIYNLLPIYPLDGGRIAGALLHILLPERVAALIIKLLSATCLCSLIAFSCYLTCYWHAGLWPVIISSLLLIRLGEMFFKEKQNFAHL